MRLLVFFTYLIFLVGTVYGWIPFGDYQPLAALFLLFFLPFFFCSSSGGSKESKSESSSLSGDRGTSYTQSSPISTYTNPGGGGDGSTYDPPGGGDGDGGGD